MLSDGDVQPGSNSADAATTYFAGQPPVSALGSTEPPDGLFANLPRPPPRLGDYRLPRGLCRAPVLPLCPASGERSASDHGGGFITAGPAGELHGRIFPAGRPRRDANRRGVALRPRPGGAAPRHQAGQPTRRLLRDGLDIG